MSDRPASWRMVTRKQMDKMAAAAAVGKNAPASQPLGPTDMPAEYWEAVLRDVAADARPSGPSIRTLKLSQIARHVLRVSCSRGRRTVEIQKADAIRLYGEQAVWKDAAQRLLDDTCQARTGRYEEDGCWPAFEY